MPSTAAQMRQPGLDGPLTTLLRCAPTASGRTGQAKAQLAGHTVAFHFKGSPQFSLLWALFDHMMRVTGRCLLASSLTSHDAVGLKTERWYLPRGYWPVPKEGSLTAAWVLRPHFLKASSFVLSLINFHQLLKVNDLASGDSQITGAGTLLLASTGHHSVTFIYWINPPVSSRRTTAKWPLIAGWCADETNLQRDCKPLFLHLLLLFLWD